MHVIMSACTGVFLRFGIQSLKKCPKRDWVEHMPGPRKKRAQMNLDLGEVGRPRVRGGGFLHSLTLAPSLEPDEWPDTIPAVRAVEAMDRLEFHPAVTFFIGENGTGKSTLLEAIATKFGFDDQGGAKKGPCDDLKATSTLHARMRLNRGRHHTDGWFLRAESFYNVATYLEDAGSNFHAYGGKSLHAQSHGEAFLALLINRLQGHGLYLFDEPEAALSPQRQLSVLTYLHRLVRHDSQLVIATHSPILLAYPHARIYEFSSSGLREVRYEETEHFQVTRDFLNRHERMVELLIREEEEEPG